ncbi:MAG: hypothetical protein QNJ55_11185 [Xenococcus sp. MO_188.B8]|nr:hypothetical protein [Xenococcus sp. MO_188.B8]
MPFGISMMIRHGIKSALQSMGMKPEVAARIGSAASIHTVATIADHHAYFALSQEKILEAIDSTSETDSEAVNQITTDSDALVNEMENIIASVEKGYDYTLNNLDSTKTEEILSQIDLAQARISKDQEEIESLAKETDKLLNQLEYKAI